MNISGGVRCHTDRSIPIDVTIQYKQDSMIARIKITERIVCHVAGAVAIKIDQRAGRR